MNQGQDWGHGQPIYCIGHSGVSAMIEATAAYSHHELADERRRALQFLADRIDALAAM